MSKNALCVSKEEVAKILNFGFSFSTPIVLDERFCLNQLNDIKMTIEDRATCETDESLLQIIPYIILKDKLTYKIFVYGRGKASGESRLVGKLSIGLGGHIETIVDSNLLSSVTEAAYRELVEEIGLKTDKKHCMATLRFSFDHLSCILYNSEDAVGRVHLGLSIIALISQDEITKLEDGVIENGEWKTLEELCDLGEKMEPWSQSILQLMVDMDDAYNKVDDEDCDGVDDDCDGADDDDFYWVDGRNGADDEDYDGVDDDTVGCGLTSSVATLDEMPYCPNKDEPESNNKTE
jgi:predicted NUDIX family phosphoesterase